MSLLWGDGVAFYGTGATSRTNMTQGIWAQVDSPITVETTNPRSPGTHHLRFAAVQGDIVRRVLGADYGAAGHGFGQAYYFSALPTDNTSHVLFQARDGANLIQYTVTLSTTGVIQVRLGDHNGSVVAQSSAPAMVASAYQHMELFAVCGNAGASPGGGQIEIRVNGQTVVNANGIDLQNQGLPSVEQYVWGSPNTSPVFTGTMDCADPFAWNDSGAVNNDFLGDLILLRINPTGDETASDWVRNTGANDYETIDDTAPDADTTYIEATVGSPNAVSEYSLSNVPANTSDVIAVITQAMMRKTDAGDGSVQVSMLSSDIGSPPAPAASNGTDRPMTTSYTYYADIHQTDPATGVRWTPSAVNAARLRLTRTL